jgi:hypothetical protein
LQVRVLRTPWFAELEAWKTARVAIIGGHHYKLLGWEMTTHNFKNCLTGEPTDDAPVLVLIEGLYQMDQFAAGELLKVQ